MRKLVRPNYYRAHRAQSAVLESVAPESVAGKSAVKSSKSKSVGL